MQCKRLTMNLRLKAMWKHFNRTDIGYQAHEEHDER